MQLIGTAECIKYHFIVHIYKREWAVPPTNTAGFNIESDFVAESNLFKRVGIKELDTTHRHHEVRTINRYQHGVKGVANLPVFE